MLRALLAAPGASRTLEARVLEHPRLGKDRAVGTRITQFAMLVGLMVGGPSALGQDPESANVAPRWKFEPGEVVHFAMTQETTNISRPEGGKAMTNTMSQTVDLKWTVGSVSPDGVAKITQTIDRVRAKIANEDQPAPFMFDSDGAPLSKADEADPFASRVVPLLRALAGAEFQFTMTARGEVEDVAISDKLRDALRQANPAAGESAVSDDGLKNLLAQVTLALPRGVEAGKTWTRETEVPLPSLGTLTMKRIYADEGPESPGSSVHKISLKTEVTHQAEKESPLEMKITDQKGTGLYRFDVEAGRVVSAQIEDSMTMTLAAGGQRIEQTTLSKTNTEMASPPNSSSK